MAQKCDVLVYSKKFQAVTLTWSESQLTSHFLLYSGEGLPLWSPAKKPVNEPLRESLEAGIHGWQDR